MLPGDLMASSHTTPRLPVSVRNFIDTVRRRADQNGVRLILSEEAMLPYMGDPEMLVSGYFIDRPHLELAVAMGKPLSQWLGVLVHESCHMDQWLESDECWKEVFMPDGRESVDWLNDWVARRMELSEEQLQDVVARCRRVELDCERRAVARIQEYDLPLPIDDYIRKANAYVYFYDFIATSRQWYPADAAPYDREDVHSHAPHVFTDNPEDLVALRQAYQRVYARPRVAVSPSPSL